MIVTEEMLLNNTTKHISKPLDSYFISFGLNLRDHSYLYPSCIDYHSIYLVRINTKAFGYSLDNKVYFNVPSFEKMKNRSIEYLASLLVSVYAHESVNHDIIDYNFIPPIKEVQYQLDRFYNKEDHDRETLPCYFSMAMLGCEKSLNKLYECGKGLLVNQYYILRGNIIQSISEIK